MPCEDVDVGAAGEDVALGAPDQRPRVGALDFGDPRLERLEGLSPEQVERRVVRAPAPPPPHRAPAAPVQPSLLLVSFVEAGREPIRAASARPGDRLVAGLDLARVLRRLELGEQLAQLGPLGDAELGGELVAGEQRPRRAVAAPVERGGEHLAGQLEVRLDRLLGREGAAATGREAVGDGEQGDVGGDRLGRPQVLVDAARRQRHLVDEEAEAQVVQGQRPQVRGQRAAGAQPAAGGADHLGAGAVVADEGDVAAALAAGGGLADVVEEGAEAQRGAAGHLVGERLVEQRARLARRARRRSARGRPRPRACCSSTASVWPWTSRWWFGPLLDVAQLGELGQDDGGEAELVEQGQAAQRVGAADQLAQLDELALAGRLGGARSLGAGELGRRGVDLELELGGEPRGAQQAQRVGGEAALADGAQEAPLEVGEAAVRVDRLAAGERDGDGADREVALGEVGLDRLAAQRGRVDLPGLLAVDHAPGRELGRELEGVRRRRSGRSPSPPPRGSPATARSRSVTSPPSAASRTAPPAIQASIPASAERRRGRARPPAPPKVDPSRLTPFAPLRRSRGTRAEIPQVTS